MTGFTYVILFAVVCRCSALIKLPDYIKLCSPKDSECLKSSLNELRPHLVQGIPKFNLSSIDPLDLPNYNQSNPFLPQLNYFASINDLQYRGLSNFTVTKFEVDLDQLRLTLKIDFPHVLITANETISADGFGIKTEGEGPVKGVFSNLTLGFSLFGTEISKDGERYVNWREDIIIVSYDRGTYEVHSSFKRGRDGYQRIFNKGRDQHPKILNPEVQRIIKNTLAKFVLESLNFVHGTYPIDALYLTENRNTLKRCTD